MTANEFRDALQIKFRFVNANIMDVLDERNESGFWRGYRMAILELMSMDIQKSLSRLNK